MKIFVFSVLYSSEDLLFGCSSCEKIVTSQSNRRNAYILIGLLEIPLSKHNHSCRNNGLVIWCTPTYNPKNNKEISA